MSGVIAAAGITAAAGLGGSLLSKGGSGGQQATMQQSQVPQTISQEGMDNWDMAVQVANNWMPAYAGQRVANLTPEQQNLISQLYGNVGSTNAGFNQALGMVNGLSGFTPSTITPQTLAGTNLQPYMNPYTQAVINPSMQLLEQQRQQGLNQIGQQASQVGAFGGSRQGVQEGVTNAQTNLLAGQLGANLWGQNFGQAQAAATGDIQRNLMGQQLNQAAAQNAAQLRLSAAGQYGNQAAQQQQNWLTGVQAAMGGQQQIQQNQQAQLAAAQQYYQEQQQNALQKLQIREQALQAQPYGQTQYGVGPGPSTNPLLSGLGTAGTTVGILGSTGAFGPNCWLTGGGGNTVTPATYFPTGMGGADMYSTGAFGLGPSDRRLKTDIQKLGKDDSTGLDLYAYRFKGDPKSYPKVVGPMAQDVQKKYPDQVVKVGDYLAVNRNFLSGMGVGHG